MGAKLLFLPLRARARYHTYLYTPLRARARYLATLHATLQPLRARARYFATMSARHKRAEHGGARGLDAKRVKTSPIATTDSTPDSTTAFKVYSHNLAGPNGSLFEYTSSEAGDGDGSGAAPPLAAGSIASMVQNVGQLNDVVIGVWREHFSCTLPQFISLRAAACFDADVSAVRLVTLWTLRLKMRFQT